MTGGIVAVLGRAGRNFAAGMSNGVAYVMDEAGTFGSRVNHDMVELVDLDDVDAELLHRLVREHEEKTVSSRARALLVHWNDYLPKFRKVVPQGATIQVGTIRTAYLSSPAGGREVALARLTA
jgi:glutamate synthase domain-containing protein 3